MIFLSEGKVEDASKNADEMHENSSPVKLHDMKTGMLLHRCIYLIVLPVYEVGEIYLQMRD